MYLCPGSPESTTPVMRSLKQPLQVVKSTRDYSQVKGVGIMWNADESTPSRETVYVVYELTHKHLGRKYIGQTKQSMQRRWKQHCIKPTRSMHKDIPFGASFASTYTCHILYTTHMQNVANRIERRCIAKNVGGYNVLRGPPKHDRRFYHMMRSKKAKI